MLMLLLLVFNQSQLAQVPEKIGLAPHWIVGQELLFRGSVKEENLSQAIQLTNEYKLEVRALALCVNNGVAEVAFLTKLGHIGAAREQADSASIQLTTAMVDSVGKITSTSSPHGTFLPVDGPATWEHGWILTNSPAEQKSGSSWEIAESGHLPFRYKIESVNESGMIIQGEQRSNDWDSPRADSTAWKRMDKLTFDFKFCFPQKISRLIERRAPAHQKITSRFLTEYELASVRTLDGPNLKAQLREIQQIRTFQQQLQALAGILGTSQARLEFQRLGREMERFQLSSGGTPYREALSSLQALVQAGCENRLANLQVTCETTTQDRKTIPDLQLLKIDDKSSITLSQFRGQPCLLVFARPDTELTRQAMMWIPALQRKLGQAKFACLILFTTDDQKVMQASFIEPAKYIHFVQGHALATTLNVTETPHFVVLDVDGAMAGSFTGWGPEPRRDLEKLLRSEAGKSRK